MSSDNISVIEPEKSNDYPAYSKLIELWRVCEKWRDKYKPSGPESIIQCDHIYINLHELADEVAEIIGYHEEDNV